MSRNESFTCLYVFWTVFSLVECSLEFVFKQARSIKIERASSNVNESVVIGQRVSCRVRHVTHITNLTAINLRTNSCIKAASVVQFGRLFFTVYISTSAFKIKLVSSQSEPRVHRLACNICDSTRVLLVCRWRHGGHVGGQEQKHFSPLGTSRKKFYCTDPQHGCLVK